MRRRANQSGFSLLELLVVIAIFGVVTTLSSAIFIQMRTVWGQSVDRVDLEDVALNAFAQMRKDFDQIIPSALSDAVISGTDGQVETPQFYGVRVDDDTIILPVYMPLGSQGKVTGARVQYRIERRGSSSSLIRTTGDLHGGAPVGNPLTVAQNVVGLDIQFAGYGDSGWQDAWSGPDAPEAVRVSLLMMREGDRDSQVARVMVMRIHVD